MEINTISKKKKSDVFELMHMEKVVARILSNGKAIIIQEKFLPYDLYLEEDDENDIDILVNNLMMFIGLEKREKVLHLRN